MWITFCGFTSNIKRHQPYPKLHILNSNDQTKNLVEDDKPSYDACIKLAQSKP
jgi:hypothetical protein